MQDRDQPEVLFESAGFPLLLVQGRGAPSQPAMRENGTFRLRMQACPRMEGNDSDGNAPSQPSAPSRTRAQLRQPVAARALVPPVSTPQGMPSRCATCMDGMSQALMKDKSATRPGADATIRDMRPCFGGLAVSPQAPYVRQKASFPAPCRRFAAITPPVCDEPRVSMRPTTISRSHPARTRPGCSGSVRRHHPDPSSSDGDTSPKGALRSREGLL